MNYDELEQRYATRKKLVEEAVLAAERELVCLMLRDEHEISFTDLDDRIAKLRRDLEEWLEEALERVKTGEGTPAWEEAYEASRALKHSSPSEDCWDSLIGQIVSADLPRAGKAALLSRGLTEEEIRKHLGPEPLPWEEDSK